MPRSGVDIPRYALLGEDPTGSREELVHCETIAARSVRYDWNIPAHRHPALCQLLLVFEGQAAITLGSHGEDPCVPFILIVPSGTVHAFRFEPGVRGFVLTLSNRLVQSLGQDALLRNLLGEPHIASISAMMADRLRAMGEQVLLASGHEPPRELLRRSLAEALLRIAAEECGQPARQHGDRLVMRFQALVEAHCRRERRLAFYAQGLCCTERTLTRRVGEALGVSPMDYLHQRLAVEATGLLRFTNASCADVADELSFEDPSYFSRWYRRMTGRRPSTISGRQRAGRGSS